MGSQAPRTAQQVANADTIKILEDLLALAKSGEVVTVVAVVTSIKGEVLPVFTPNLLIDVIVGRLEIVKQAFLKGL